MGLDANAVDRIAAAIGARAGEPLLFAAALDGVLAPYHRHPARVRLTAQRRARLRHLQSSGATVAIVSGRPVHEVQRHTGLGEDVFCIGLHGLQIVGPGFERVQQGVIDAYRRRLCEVYDELRPILAGVAGVNLEFKEAAVALHTRDAGSEDAVWCRFQLLNSVADLLHCGAVRAIRGRDVLEVLPDVGPSRAAALAAIQGWLQARQRQSVFTVYIGADSTDDDAFEAIDDRSVGMVVGRRPRDVALHLRPADVDRVIEILGTEACQRRGCEAESCSA